MENKFCGSILITFLFLHCVSLLCSAQDFDFFYFVQQWPGSYCDTSEAVVIQRPEASIDFGIHGLWPNYKDGSYPSNCDPDNSYDQSKVSDLISRMQQEWSTLSCPSNSGTKFWSHEWNKHGTCSESVLDQHSYFKAALDLKSKIDLLQILRSADINPDGGSYSLSNIKSTISNAIGYTPYIQCNVDEDGNSQLYQIYICVDNSGSNLIECPVFPRGRCGSSIEFPSF